MPTPLPVTITGTIVVWSSSSVVVSQVLEEYELPERVIAEKSVGGAVIVEVTVSEVMVTVGLPMLDDISVLLAVPVPVLVPVVVVSPLLLLVFVLVEVTTMLEIVLLDPVGGLGVEVLEVLAVVELVTGLLDVVFTVVLAVDSVPEEVMVEGSVEYFSLELG